MKNLICFALLALLINPSSASSQTAFNSFNNDNYSGSFATSLQPAAIADSRFKWYLGAGGNYSFSNNYLATNTSRYLNNSLQQSAYRDHRGKGYYFEATEVNILNGFVTLSEKDAVGYSWKIKTFTNYDGLSNELSALDFSKFTDPDLIGTTFNQGRLSYQHMQWAEHSINYARTIIDDEKRFVKVGGAIKILNGTRATQLYTDGGDVTFLGNGNLQFDGMAFSYGRSTKNNLDRYSLGFGGDLGIVYEYRPSWREYFYKMDNVKKNPSKHENKYKYKVGASILNIGAIRFAKDTNSFDFINSNNNVIDYQSFINATSASLNEGDIDKRVLNNVEKDPNNKEVFTMSLPTNFNIHADYRWKERIYFNYALSIPLWLYTDKSKVHDLITTTVGARYETQLLTAGMPITLQRNGQVNLGLYGAFRLSKKDKGMSINLFFGANNINNLIGQRRVYNANVYAGLAVGFLHKKPSDIDKDYISDKNDWCVTDKGTYKLKGCPDTDEDGIPDYKDYCPYTFGPKVLNGCPDSDGDGLLDYEDQCKYEKGLKINKGCPDRDKDGIIDKIDRCPDLPGVWENNGCQLEPLVCCLDSDADGLNDEIDSCKYEAGPASNQGCPTSETTPIKDKTKYEKPKKKKIEEVLDEQKAKIEEKTAREVLDEMATIDYINIFFDVDDSRITEIYNEKIRGFATKVNQNANTLILIMAHTDSDGSIEYNKTLAAKRAFATKQELLTRGVKENRIVIKNYGEEKAAVENTTKENKAKNRRVEVRMMKLN